MTANATMRASASPQNATATANDSTAQGGSRSSGGAQQGQLASVNIDTSSAARFNKQRSYSRDQWKKIQEIVGAKVDGIPGPETARKVAAWQQSKNLAVDGKVGRNTLREINSASSGAAGAENTDATDTNAEASQEDAEASGEEIPSGNVTANFSWAEFACNDRNNTPVPRSMRPRIIELCQQLEVLRTAIGGKSIRINSGYRTPAYNRAVGGASRSQHVQCRASDMMVTGMSPRRVADTITRLVREGKMKQGGIGRYNSFTHYDIRGSAARWGSN